jgi:hypothetical protein
MTHSIPTHLRGSVRTALGHRGAIFEGELEFEGRDLVEVAEDWWQAATQQVGWANGLNDRQVQELLAVMAPIIEYADNNNYGDPADEESFPDDVKFANQSEEILAWFTDAAMTSVPR